MNIEGLGDETIELLYRNSLIGDVADLYSLKVDDLSQLPRLGIKSAQNIVDSVEASKQTPLARSIFALGIRYVGETTAKYLSSHFLDMDTLMAASRDELLQVEEVGDRIADSIMEYFSSEKSLSIINRIKEAGVKMEAEQSEKLTSTLDGLSFVISGKFTTYSRDEIKALIESHSGRNLSAVSSSVDYLIAGDKIGPAKLQKATKLGVKIISESEFIEMLSTSSDEPKAEQATQGELF